MKHSHARTGKPNEMSLVHSFNAAIKGVCDVMRRSNVVGAVQYVPELTWILFLRILDAQEMQETASDRALGLVDSGQAIPSPYRWRDWGAPYSDRSDQEAMPCGSITGWKRNELYEGGSGSLLEFVNNDLLPFLREFASRSDATPRQKLIGTIMTSVEKAAVSNEAVFREILDRIDGIGVDLVRDRHFSALSQVYESLLLKMGEKNSDGGQFFTPRDVIRAMVRTVDPKVGQTVYDPCCGTGGFLAEAYAHMEAKTSLSTKIEKLRYDTFFGREKANLVFPIALANLFLHGIHRPSLWHGNTLTGETDVKKVSLFDKAPSHFDVILTNPPFGGKENASAMNGFDFKTSSTQVLFVQKILKELSDGGTCGIVLDDGILFKDMEAFVDTKRKLLEECDLWAVVSLPAGVFASAGANVETNLLFFTKGKRTDKIWYYDLTHVKVGKRDPLTLAHFGYDTKGAVLEDKDLPESLTRHWRENGSNTGGPFPSYARLLSKRGTPKANSPYSWTVSLSKKKGEADKERRGVEKEVTVIEDTIRMLEKEISRVKRRKEQGDEEAINDMIENLKQMKKKARAKRDRIKRIEGCVYDLTAQNPNDLSKVDSRSSLEIIRNIQSQEKIISKSLSLISRIIISASDSGSR